jgi:hypothetical protein
VLRAEEGGAEAGDQSAGLVAESVELAEGVLINVLQGAGDVELAPDLGSGALGDRQEVPELVALYTATAS